MKEFEEAAYLGGDVSWKNELKISYDTIGYNDFLSIRFRVYQFTGGNHGMDSMIVKNYNKKDGSEVFLTSIFKSDSEYLKKLSDLIVPQLAYQMKNKGLIKDFKKDVDLMNFIYSGASAKIENFDNFYFVNGGVVFHFNKTVNSYHLLNKFSNVYLTCLKCLKK